MLAGEEMKFGGPDCVCCNENRKSYDVVADEILASIEDEVRSRKENKMHYRNGREAKNGDKIVRLGDTGQIQAFGVLHSAAAGSGDYCNGNIAVVQTAQEYACLCDCLHVDDVAAIFKEKGLDKRPAGK